mgnify:CR=1 FL=1
MEQRSHHCLHYGQPCVNNNIYGNGNRQQRMYCHRSGSRYRFGYTFGYGKCKSHVCMCGNISTTQCVSKRRQWLHLFLVFQSGGFHFNSTKPRCNSHGHHLLYCNCNQRNQYHHFVSYGSGKPAAQCQRR